MAYESDTSAAHPYIRSFGPLPFLPTLTIGHFTLVLLTCTERYEGSEATEWEKNACGERSIVTCETPVIPAYRWISLASEWQSRASRASSTRWRRCKKIGLFTIKNLIFYIILLFFLYCQSIEDARGSCGHKELNRFTYISAYNRRGPSRVLSCHSRSTIARKW